MVGVAAFALSFSTFTDAPLDAMAVLVTSSLFTLDAASPLGPYMPTRYWLALVDFFRDPISWGDSTRGLALQGATWVCCRRARERNSHPDVNR